ncbi:hypothetical protein GCM10010345_66400 [Streptomyces canarius]|uniref:Uncharacterized protein n=1 Tax=Streptomyces canarius TaxID=285453 RepID=A0ABQ3D2D9_9ACTN|nr:hypothetical protein GCM10010345_66400 [Streptomyces canarius]
MEKPLGVREKGMDETPGARRLLVGRVRCPEGVPADDSGAVDRPGAVRGSAGGGVRWISRESRYGDRPGS